MSLMLMSQSLSRNFVLDWNNLGRHNRGKHQHSWQVEQHQGEHMGHTSSDASQDRPEPKINAKVWAFLLRSAASQSCATN